MWAKSDGNLGIGKDLSDMRIDQDNRQLDYEPIAQQSRSNLSRRLLHRALDRCQENPSTSAIGEILSVMQTWLVDCIADAEEREDAENQRRAGP